MSLADANRIRDVLSAHRFIVEDEKTLQAQIAGVLDGASIAYEREVHLAPGDIIDFLAGRIGIEVKIKGGKRAILRQLERYAQSERIGVLLLVSAVAMGLPATINGKPVVRSSLGRAWL